jgi:hypothetical protein
MQVFSGRFGEKYVSKEKPILKIIILCRNRFMYLPVIMGNTIFVSGMMKTQFLKNLILLFSYSFSIQSASRRVH